MHNNSAAISSNNNPTPTPSSDLDDVNRVSPLPVFNNPAYESSSDDQLENDTASSTVSAEHQSQSRRHKSGSSSTSTADADTGHQTHAAKTPPDTPLRKNSDSSSSKDPIEDLRSLAREISPGITLTRADADHILKVTQNMTNCGNGNVNHAFDNEDAGSGDKKSQSRRTSTNSLSLKNQKNNELCLKIDAKQLSARNGKSTGGTVFDTEYSNDLDADLKRMSKMYKNKKGKNTKEGEDSESASGTSTQTKIFGFTLQQCALFLLFAIANILSGICISLQAPFYPEVALEKGATYTENGMVFSCFELTVFIMAPLFGKNMNRIGPKLVFNTGIILTALCSSVFGFLIHIDDRYAFIGLSIIIRVFEAVGAAAHVTASFTLIAVVFPDTVSTVFAMMETCTGLGLIVGPVVGGALHQLGGFTVPFVAIGGLLFLCFVFGYVTLMRLDMNANKKEEDPTQKQYGYRDILTIPVVALSGLSILTAAISIGYNAPVLERHIARFNLTKVETGLVFIINGGTYAITAPFWGRLCDKLERPRFLTLLGAVFILIGFLFIGPIFFIPFDTILWVTCLGLFIQGLGLGANFVSGFALALKDSIASGLPDGIGTYGLVSGLWMSAFSLGNFIGPSLSGVLQDSVGYRTGSISVMGVQIVVVLIALVFLVRGNQDTNPAKKKKDTDLEVDAESGIAVRQAKFFTTSFDEKF